MRKPISTRFIMAACLLGWLLAFASMTQAGGTFRFLTQSLPGGTTNQEYFAVLLTANAAGPVTFSAANLPDGLSLNSQTGYITGTPTKSQNYTPTLSASDGHTTVQFTITVHISASGGGGNGGLDIVTSSLPNGTVGSDYTSPPLTQANAVSPYRWGAQNLPTGLSLNGITGEISGQPVTAGTFYVTFTLADATPLQVITTIPITIFPVDSSFKFTTFLLNNGEVGTSYSDTWHTTGAAVCNDLPDPNQIIYSAAGLPAGLSVNANTGMVSGTPQENGTFSVTLTAQDCAGKTITTNLWIWIAPSSTSNFYWNYFGIPTAIYGMQYGSNNFPILVSAVNGANVTYSAVGLPAGINYNSTTGELSGISYEPGIYPVVFTATDSGPNPDVAIALATEFIVLPPNGGDTNSLAVNLWVKRLQVDTGKPGGNDDSWSATFLYNANRAGGALFNPATEIFYTSLGGSEIEIAPGNLKKITSGTLGILNYEAPDQSVKVKIAPRQQTLFVETHNTNLGNGLPADLLPNVLILGGKGFKLKEFLDQSGTFRAPSGYRSTAFVAVNGLIRANADAAKNYARFNLLLADPTYDYAPGDPVRIRLMSGQSVLLDKELTSLIEPSTGVDRVTGIATFSLKKTWKSDPASNNKLAKFAFDSATGKLGFELKAPTLSALTNSEEHLGVEITLGSKTYFTSVTLFKIADGRYSTAK
ncbi:Ig domain-containing protein [Methylomicrobium lacus]|uniref:Ig domain-containing protein n=1 Tax=Methylomicrobium lacus TaxID=136992 RepID=UPI0035A8AE53